MIHLVDLTNPSLFKTKFWNFLEIYVKNYSNNRIEIQSTIPSADQALELKIFLKQLLTHSNFMWFAAMNLVQVSHRQIYKSMLYTLWILHGAPYVGNILACCYNHKTDRLSNIPPSFQMWRGSYKGYTKCSDRILKELSWHRSSQNVRTTTVFSDL